VAKPSGKKRESDEPVSGGATPPPRRAGWIVAAVAAALFAVFFAVPWQPADEAPIGAFDFSWMLVLHDAVASGRQFGREIVLPQGPMGFFGTSVYDPRTFPVLIALRVAAALVAFWALWRIARRFIAHPALAAPWAIVIFALIGRSPDHFFPACGLLLLFNHFFIDDRRPSRATIALTVVIAAASLIKVNQPFYAAAVIGTAALGQAARRDRRALVLPAVYLLSVAAFYFAARQRPSSAGAFLWGWYQVTAGHTDAVGLPGPVSDALVYLAVAAAVAAGAAVCGGRVKRRAGLLPALGTAAVLLLLYKHSFMRQDIWHVHMGPTVVVAAALVLTPLLWPLGRGARYACIATLVVSGVALSTVLSSYTNQSLIGYAVTVADRTRQNVSAAGGILSGSGRLRSEWEAARRKLRDENPLPLDQIVGPVDVYPHRQDVVLAYGLPYRPRPVISSLVASGAPLAELNAAHLRGPGAAPTILFDVELVDRNFPTALDGLSLPELLTRYDVADATGAMLVLRKSAAPRPWKLTPLTTLTGTFEEPIVLPAPAGAPLWARFRFTPRAATRVKSVLYKPPTVGIVVRTADGAERNFRLLPGIAAEHGFLISPLIENRASYAALASGEWAVALRPAVVTSILVFVEGSEPQTEFEPTFSVELERMGFAPQPLR
jgi:hypothetical protein